MEKVKKIILFIIGLYIIPAIVAYMTAFILKTDIFERLYICLFFDYMLVYVLTPLIYKPRVQKYISNKYLFFTLIFCLFWLFEMLRIIFI